MYVELHIACFSLPTAAQLYSEDKTLGLIWAGFGFSSVAHWQSIYFVVDSISYISYSEAAICQKVEFLHIDCC